ncbi:coiled-coil domain-containing protein [Mycoplasma bradburyae]|uniref:Uncharacterized protein n=1 Tax=Mycoplasma bradburyae TaxID=2963128 RepID=A0ABT5GAI3_9MOLU|nr:hypothetical protein [Mycoplasma bradburyae]MDC4181984.1 hypothetical protein [Mycoplasma bradburyae]UTS70409.1 hypothetical protein NMG68_01575 [Mycoplasma bradburyae]
MDNKNNSKRSQFYFNRRESANRPKVRFNDFDSKLINDNSLDIDKKDKNKNIFDGEDDFDFLKDVIEDYDNLYENKKSSVINESNKNSSQDTIVPEEDEEDDLDLEFHRSRIFDSNQTDTKDQNPQVNKTRFVGDDDFERSQNTNDNDENLIEAFTKNLSSFISAQDDNSFEITEQQSKKTNKTTHIDLKQATEEFYNQPITQKETKNQKTDIITKTKQEDDYAITENHSDYSFESTDDVEEKQVDLTDMLDVDYEPDDDSEHDLPSTSEVLNASFDEEKTKEQKTKTKEQKPVENISDNEQIGNEIYTEKIELSPEVIAKKDVSYDDTLEEITKEDIINATKQFDLDHLEQKNNKRNKTIEQANNQVIKEISKLVYQDVNNQYQEKVNLLEKYKENLEEREREIERLNEELDRKQVKLESINKEFQEAIKDHQKEMDLEKLNLEKQKEEILAKANKQADEILKQAYEKANEYKLLAQQSVKANQEEQSNNQIVELKQGFDNKLNQLSTKINKELDTRLVKKDQMLNQLLSQLKIMAETTHSNQLRINELFLDVNNKEKEIQVLKRDLAILRATTNQVVNIKTEKTREISRKHFEDFELDNSYKDPSFEQKLESITNDLSSLSSEIVYEPSQHDKLDITKKTLRTFNLSDLNESLEEDRKIFKSINKHLDKSLQQVRTDTNLVTQKIHNPSYINKYKQSKIINDEDDYEEWSLNDIKTELTDEYNSFLAKTKTTDFKDKKPEPTKKQKTKKVQLVFDSKK